MLTSDRVKRIHERLRRERQDDDEDRELAAHDRRRQLENFVRQTVGLRQGS